METRININYTPSKTSEVFGLFTLSFQGSDGKVHSVDTKFNPKQLWEFSRDTSSVAFDLLVLSMIVYNVDRAVLRLSNSDDGWKRNLILLNVPVINLEDMYKVDIPIFLRATIGISTLYRQIHTRIIQLKK